MRYCDNTAISRSHRLTGIVFALLPVVLVGFVIRLIFALQSPIDQADGLSVAAAFAWGCDPQEDLCTSLWDVCERYGWRVNFDSTADRGTRFEVTF